MKKILVLLLTVALVLNLSGCCCIPVEDIIDSRDTYGEGTTTDDYEFNSYVYEEESEVTYSSEESLSQASQPSSEPQSQPHTSQPAPVAKDPKSYTMHDYYGMTINDVANIWGRDYTLMNGLLYGGWAGIYYEDERCPFVFCYQSSSIPTSCSGNERLSGIIAYPYPDENEFLVIEGLSIVSSYATVKGTFGGEYWVNEVDGGYCYSCSAAQNNDIVFKWNDGQDIPWEISVSFMYMF